MRTRIFGAAAALVMAVLFATLPMEADAQRAAGPHVGGGSRMGPAPAAGYRGGYPAGGYRGGYPAGGYSGGGWRGHGYGHGYAGRSWGWRHGWGWGGWGWGGWGWGGWGWGVGWWPGWGWGGYPGWGGSWGWSVGAPVVVTPPAGTQWSAYGEPFYVERAADAPAATSPPPPPEQWWYWCTSARGYYPYVQTCAEGWQRVTPQIPPGQ